MDHHPISEDPKTPLLPLHDQIQRSQSFHSSLKSILTLKNFFVLLGPLLCTIICLCVKLDGPVASWNMLAVLVWVFAWWLTEAVPMPITSMSPHFLFPFFGISSADDVAQSYMDDVIALLLGSFILALAVEHYNIHRRLALNRSLESAIAAVGNMWDCSIHQHVDAQRGNCGDDDARGHRHSPAVSYGSRPIRGCEQLLQSRDSGGVVLHNHRRDEHSDGDRCQSHIGWNVEELFPTSSSDHLQHLILFRLPFGIVDVFGFVGFALLHVLLKGFRPGSLCLFRQSPFEEGA